MEGYKTEQFLDKMDNNFLCPICEDVFRDPVSCKEGHSFCRYCIEQWLRSVNHCPLDNSLIKDKNFVRNLALKGYIDNLNVYCHPQETVENNEVTAASQVSIGSKDAEQCDWVGKLQNLAKHQTTCPFQVVNCYHQNCIIKIQRRHIIEHEKTCNYKIDACDKCRAVLVRHEIEKHKIYDCQEVLIQCPSGCTGGFIQNVKRKDLDDHLATVCGKTLVDCPYKKQGCLKQVERQDVETHEQEDKAAHMKLVENQNSQLQVELKEVKRKRFNKSIASYLWKIYDYESMAKTKTKGTSFTSPMFLQCGHRWMLEVYPNGSNISGFGMVFVHLYWMGDEEGNQYQNSKVSAVASLEVLSVIPETKDHCMTRNVAFTKTNDYWEWDRFIGSNTALSKTFCDRATGILQIQCTIRLNDEH